MTTPAPIRALVVDDEPLARRGVCARLERAGGIVVAGECASGREAIVAIRAERPDLVFLDVQMPGMDGFAVVAEIGAERMPLVIFVTAYDEHALRAFEAGAVDYLLKPIDDERFERTLARARERLSERRDGALARRLSAVLTEAGAALAPEHAPTKDARIVVRDRSRLVLIDEREIEWVGAEGDYVRLYVAGRSHLHRETMSALERQLGAAFVRIHRSTIVQVARIRELRGLTNGDFVVILRDGTELRASRSYADRLRERFGAL